MTDIIELNDIGQLEHEYEVYAEAVREYQAELVFIPYPLDTAYIVPRVRPVIRVAGLPDLDVSQGALLFGYAEAADHLARFIENHIF